MFYENFKKLCAEKGISVYKAVNDMGIGQSTATRWKQGTAVPRAETLQKIADYFGVSTDYLLGNETEKSPATAENDELNEYLEELKNREEMRMLFSLAKGATKEDVQRAVAIIEALRGKGD